MNESWQDADITSLHGRSIKGLVQKINGKEKIALLTDEENKFLLRLLAIYVPLEFQNIRHLLLKTLVGNKSAVLFTV